MVVHMLSVSSESREKLRRLRPRRRVSTTTAVRPSAVWNSMSLFFEFDVKAPSHRDGGFPLTSKKRSQEPTHPARRGEVVHAGANIKTKPKETAEPKSHFEMRCDCGSRAHGNLLSFTGNCGD